MIFRSLIGTMAMIGTTSLPSGVATIVDSIFHWLCQAPLLNPHSPDTTMPPSTTSAVPDGTSVPQIRTSGSANTSC